MDRSMCPAPHNLLEDVGLKTVCGRGMITALYRALAALPPQARERVIKGWRDDTGRGGKPGARAQAREDRAVEELAGTLGLEGRPLEPEFLLIAVHTYFAILIKVLATPLLGFPYPDPEGVSVEDMGKWMAGVEGQKIFFLAEGRGAASPWYLAAWDSNLARCLQQVVNRLRDYDFAPGRTPHGDCLQYLYHSLLPPALRHGLGEHYTPRWLVEHLYQLLAPRLLPPPAQGKGGLLDPTCGSGAFLLPALELLRKKGMAQGVAKGEILAAASRLVVGIDRNPLAVLSARVNYLMAVADLLPPEPASFLPPVFLGDTILNPPPQLRNRHFDHIIGNPPWINWETLSPSYRQQTKRFWAEYGLYRHQGYEALLGKSKDDLAILLTYVVLDKYLNTGGTLAFVITQSIFKTTGAGQGFRNFVLPEGIPLQVIQVEDLSAVKPFPGAKNRTALVMLRKGRSTIYPVPYIYWQILSKKGLRGTDSLSVVKKRTRRLTLAAKPVNPKDITSPWLTAGPGAIDALERIVGPSYYRAREGVNTGGANGVYYLEVQGPTGDNRRVAVKNLTAGAKRPVPEVEACLEGELIYPLLRGRDIRTWYGGPRVYILLPHREGEKLQAIPEPEMEQDYPSTARYLQGFASILRQRRTRVVRSLMAKGPFYSIFGVGDYTFAPYKVVWQRIGTRLAAAVISSREKVWLPIQELIIPNDSTVFVPFTQEAEAHYFCALLNSTPAQFVVRSTSVLATGSFASPHILEKVAIPQFQPDDPLHRVLAHLAREAAAAACQGGETGNLEGKMDEAASRLWRLTPGELAEMGRSLQSVKPS